MIKIKHDQSGLTLFEVLVAILIFAIVILGFLHFQSLLITDMRHAKHRYQAERLAFQLLEVYPAIITVDLPSRWQYHVTESQYNVQCKIVKVRIQPDLGDEIAQVRWFCRS